MTLKDPPIQHYTFEKTTIAYRESGEKTAPPICLLHGMAEESAFFWRDLIEHFESTHRIIAVDLLGHGESSNPLTGYSPARQGQLYGKLMQALDIEQAVLIGHSLGGIIGATLAVDYPNLVSKLVLYDAPIPRGFFGNAALVSDIGLGPILAVAPLGIPGIGLLLDLVTSPSLSIRLITNVLRAWKVPFDPQALGDEYLEHSIQCSYFALEQNGRQLFLFHNLEQHLSKLEIPTLLIVGDNDVLMSEKRAQTIQRLIPQCELTIIPEASHVALIDQPALFLSKLTAFIEGT
ncbi:alpha/beta fold hydrolase [Chloroflexota bacterium]